MSQQKNLLEGTRLLTQSSPKAPTLPIRLVGENVIFESEMTFIVSAADRLRNKAKVTTKQSSTRTTEK
jgi:hypothetical protein